MRTSLFVFLMLSGAVAVPACGGDSYLGDGTGGTGGIAGSTGGTGTGGSSGGTGGSTGGTGFSGTGGSIAGFSSAGTAGTGGSAGPGGGTWVWDCPDGSEAVSALRQNCARAACHNATSHYAGLDLTDPNAIEAQMVDKPALHGDINCAPSGMPARICSPDELAVLCPESAQAPTLLIDSANFESSWVLRKLNNTHGTCGNRMPYPPGDSATNGWNDVRKQCVIDFFRSLAEP